MIAIFGCTCKTINLMQNLHQPSFCLLSTKKKNALQIMGLAAYASETNKNFFDILFTAETNLDDTVSEHLAV